MRKLLLASSALVLAASPVLAAEQNGNLKLQLSGYNDFRAGYYNTDSDAAAVAGLGETNHDFEDEVKLNFDVLGKGANNFEYGGRVSLWNGANQNDAFNGGQGDIRIHEAYTYMGGNFGKVILGDSTGASDLFVYAPVVGQGQVDGSFSDFTSNATLAPFFPAYIDNEETSTKATYYTPVIAGFQVGISYIPQFYDYGQNVVKYQANTASTAGVGNGAPHPYNDVIEAGAQYNFDYRNLNFKLSGLLTTGDSSSEFGTALYQDFTAYAGGMQVGFGGFTFGGSYYDAGDFLARVGENGGQHTWSVGGTYEFGKAAVGVSYLTGKGYTFDGGALTAGSVGTGNQYTRDYDAYSVGAEYNWLPGLVTSADFVYYDQDMSAASTTPDNNGYVALLSQRVNF